jgi:hypothetical protein
MKSIAHSDSAVNRNVGESRVVDDGRSVSPALAAANRRLLAARQLKTRLAPHTASISAESPPIPDALPVGLPAHLGWHNASFVRVQSKSPNSLRIVTEPALLPDPQLQTNQPTNPVSYQPTITAHPTLLAGMVKTETVAAGRVWLLCRALDREGRGWLDIDQLRWHLVGNGRWRKSNMCADKPLALFGWRRLRQILQQGRGVFWSRDKHNRLWLHGAARVAFALGVERLAGRPIVLPLAALTDSAALTRAHCYAAFHSSRPATRRGEFAPPISRTTLAEVTHVPARTQRHYDQVVGIKQRKSVAIGARYSAEKLQNTAWERLTGTFAFVDHHGRQGEPGRQYVAWQLPNMYRGCHTQAQRGRSKKINQKLAEKQAKELLGSDRRNTGIPALVEKRERGNGIGQCAEGVRIAHFVAESGRKPVAARLFHHTVRQAVAAAAAGHAGYWRHVAAADCVIWQAVQPVPEVSDNLNN